MRIVVLSDTHAHSEDVGDVMNSLESHLKGADLILHSGDIVSAEMLEALRRLAPVEAVLGNMDCDELRQQLPEQRNVRVEGFLIGLIHGWGSPHDLVARVWQKMSNTSSEQFDAIVFGHSHQATIEKCHGVLMINPGSPTDRRWAPIQSIAAIQLDGHALTAEIIQV